MQNLAIGLLGMVSVFAASYIHQELRYFSFWVQIANRIKSKGLQKLRWYCQMCQKQCRDENGFKCHLTSESHKRQMQVFGEAPERGIAMTLVQKQRSVYKSLA